MLVLLLACQSPAPAPQPVETEIVETEIVAPAQVVAPPKVLAQAELDVPPAEPPLVDRAAVDRAQAEVAAADRAAQAARMPEPPAGALRDRLAWLERYAPLTLPDTGCAWLPAAPGCDRTAWVCVVSYSNYGSGGGTFGKDAVFGTDPEGRDDAASAAAGDGLDEGDVDAAGGVSGAGVRIQAGTEAFANPIFTSCLDRFVESHPCDGCDDDHWPGLDAAQARCEKEVAAAHTYSVDTCTVLLADACTGNVGLDCPSHHPRRFTVRVSLDASTD